MKLLIDENLSPTLTSVAHARGYQSTSVRELGLLGIKDKPLLEQVLLPEDWTLCTTNGGDFKDLCGTEELHPGLIILEDCGRARSEQLLKIALAYIEQEAARAGEVPKDYMVNKVVEVGLDGSCTTSSLPPTSQPDGAA